MVKNILIALLVVIVLGGAFLYFYGKDVKGSKNPRTEQVQSQTHKNDSMRTTHIKVRTPNGTEVEIYETATDSRLRAKTKPRPVRTHAPEPAQDSTKVVYDDFWNDW